MNDIPIFAFPIVVDYGDGVKYQTGMTLRDYFATHAMQGGIDLVPHMATPKVDKSIPQIIAEMAYEYADAMMKAREK
jgi:3-deoxy-D-arabino-heptulosonate 7-phosphate (DAHP) synthase class II